MFAHRWLPQKGSITAQVLLMASDAARHRPAAQYAITAGYVCH
jgi:hypothetical protein